MAGPINSIFAAVTARLATITTYSTAADWSFIGATKLPAADVPPRIVWVPLQESYGPPVGQGGNAISNPRPVAMRQSQFEVHLWAADATQTGQPNQNALDLDACESLLNAFMWAVYSCVHGAPSVPFVGTGRWTRGNVLGQNLTLGVGYIVPLTIWIPVTRPVETTATITRIEATVTAPTDPEVIVIT